ncbi:MAG TPA: GMP/IMP nucleotidase [Thiobacillaceae bacterium]|nr:GMP/IMP nucleotidase [Thiobacillaceae bacterium]
MIEWTRIDTVFLDMDGTLLDLHFDNHFWLEHLPRRYAERHGLAHDLAQARLADHYARHSGTLAWYCLDFWGRELALDIVELKEEVAHLIAVRPDVPAFLQALQGSGRRLVIVTNAHPRSLALKMRETGIDVYFDALVSSHRVGLPKEHPDFWKGLQAIEPFDRARTLFADDSLPVLRSAQAYGIGQLLAIRNPDSRQPHKDCAEFSGITSFHEVMPAAAPERGSHHVLTTENKESP